MDIRYKRGNSTFALRSGALILHDAKVLLVKCEQYDCYYSVGGAVLHNESSEEAVLRECFEETGNHLEIERLVYIQERFFSLDGMTHHEVTFFYLMKDMNLEIAEGSHTDQSNEHLHWVPLKDLCKYLVAPPFLKEALLNLPNEITHIVVYE